MRTNELIEGSVLQLLQDGVWVTDADDRIIFFNSAMERISGVTSDQVMGASVLTDFPEETSGTLLPHYLHSRDSLTPARYEVPVTTPAGRKTIQAGWLTPRVVNRTYAGMVCTIRDVTAERQTEQELARSSLLAQRYLNLTPALILGLDPAGRITLLNNEGARILGCEGEDVLGLDWFESFIPQSGRDELRSELTRLVTEAPDNVVLHENEVGTRHGIRLIRWHNTVVRDEAGRVTGILSAGSDITEEQAARDREAHLTAVLKGIRAVNQLIVQGEDAVRLIEGAAGHLTGPFGYSTAWIVLMDPVDGSIGQGIAARAGTTSDSGATLLECVQPGEPLARCMQLVHDSPDPVVLGNLPDACPGCPLGGHHHESTAMGRKLEFNDALYGLLRVSVTTGTMEDDELALFNEVADDLAFALHKIDESSRLRTTQQRYTEIFDGSRDGYVVQDRDGRILDANKAYCQLLGYSLAELQGFTDTSDIAPDRRHLQKPLDVAERRTPGNDHRELFERELLRKDGTRVPVEGQAYRSLSEDGSTEFLWATVRDVSPRIAAEKEYQDLFRSMLNGFALHEIILDSVGTPVDYRFLAVNPAFERLTGFAGADIVKRTALEVMPDTEPFWIRTYGEIVRGGEPVEFEHHSNVLGKTFHVSAFRTLPGQFATVFTDVTERVAAEEQLRKSESKWRSYTDSAPYGVFVADLTGRIVEVNPAGALITGFDAAELLTKSLVDLIPSAIGSRRDLDFSQLLDHSQYVGDVHFVHQSGEIRNLFLSAIRFGDDRYLGFATDTTDRERDRIELNNSRDQLRRLAQRLLTSQEDLQRQIAAELHDNLGQTLTALKMDASTIRSSRPEDHASTVRTVGIMLGLLDQLLESVKRISLDLRPGILDNLGLIPAIRWQSEQFTKRSSIAVRHAHSLDENATAFQPLVSTGLYRIFLEALTNVARHSEASVVDVSTRVEGRNLVFRIRDNGRGISPAEIADVRSLGLVGMTERSLAIGANLQVTGESGIYTCIQVTLPTDKAFG